MKRKARIMIRLMKKMLGVTLLEIMLVLAIAAVVIIMSVRYYQSASIAQQTNAIIEQIQAISAVADTIAQGAETYSGITTSGVAALMGGGGLTAPWGGGISVAGAAGVSSTYTVTIPLMGYNVCTQLTARLGTNAHFTLPGSCPAAPTSYTYTYTANI